MDDINKYSDTHRVVKNAKSYLGSDVDIRLSNRKNKKFMVYDSKNRKWVHFGQMGYKDYTKTGDKIKRDRYLSRAYNITGNWKNNPYSSNWLSIKILWDG